MYYIRRHTHWEPTLHCVHQTSPQPTHTHQHKHTHTHTHTHTNAVPPFTILKKEELPLCYLHLSLTDPDKALCVFQPTFPLSFFFFLLPPCNRRRSEDSGNLPSDHLGVRALFSVGAKRRRSRKQSLPRG